MVGAGLRVAGLVLDPLTLAVLAPVLGLGVGALPVGELHPSPAGPGAALPGSPGAPAAVHDHLRRHRQQQTGGQSWEPDELSCAARTAAEVRHARPAALEAATRSLWANMNVAKLAGPG